MSFTVALAGNPNAGKSTIFNALTGSHQHVGNWPGKTVEKKEGRLRIAEQDIALVDLPGTYSLTAFSVEETVARDFIVEAHPDAVIAVVDATNLERNLYLVLQLIETGAPVIVALNMWDIVEKQGIKIDTDQLSAALGGIPIIRTIGYRQVGLNELGKTIPQLIQHSAERKFEIPVHKVLVDAIDQLVNAIRRDPDLAIYNPRWLAVKLLEDDGNVFEKIAHNAPLAGLTRQLIDQITTETGDEPEIWIADSYYSYIETIVEGAVQRPEANAETWSDRLDSVLTHRVWGLPIFLLLMWIVFQFTANVSAPYLDWIDSVISGPFTRWVVAIMAAIGLGGSWIESLLVDGVIAGVGGVLVFIPVLFSLYFAIAILEDSGYMARAAFVMDRLMSALGLHGKSFLPLLVGFGCTVPAIYATRTLENRTDRKITAFLSTFMSCGARLPVYVIFGTAFFGAASGNLIFAMYIVGIAVAVLTSLLLTRIVYRSKPVPPFVLEMPPYRVPNARTVATTIWERSRAFLKKAGSVILMASIAIWILMAIPLGRGGFNDVEPEHSAFGRLSQTTAPVFEPAGFDDWEASGSLLTGLVAKEVVISTLTQTYVGAEAERPEASSFGEDMRDVGVGFAQATLLTVQEIVNIVPNTINLVPGVTIPTASFVNLDDGPVDDSRLETALLNNFTPLSALAFNIFILLYVPCMSATAAMRHEFGAGWMWKQIAYTFGVAWVAAVLVYQLGSMTGF